MLRSIALGGLWFTVRHLGHVVVREPIEGVPVYKLARQAEAPSRPGHGHDHKRPLWPYRQAFHL